MNANLPMNLGHRSNFELRITGLCSMQDSSLEHIALMVVLPLHMSRPYSANVHTFFLDLLSNDEERRYCSIFDSFAHLIPIAHPPILTDSSKC